MKGVLQSINKPHTDNIRAGIKNIEVRKDKPNLPTPFPVLIYETKNKGGIGKVIGEFVCDKVLEWKYLPDHTNENEYEYYIECADGHATCLTYDEIYNYGKGKPLYGWHISNLKIYDKPKEVSEFKQEIVKGAMPKKLIRPPQSWCYVEVAK